MIPERVCRCIRDGTDRNKLICSKECFYKHNDTVNSWLYIDHSEWVPYFLSGNYRALAPKTAMCFKKCEGCVRQLYVIREKPKEKNDYLKKHCSCNKSIIYKASGATGGVCYWRIKKSFTTLQSYCDQFYSPSETEGDFKSRNKQGDCIFPCVNMNIMWLCK